MFCPAEVSGVPAWPVDPAIARRRRRRRGLDELLELAAECLDLASGRPADAQLVREHGWSYDQCEHWITATLTATLLA